MQRCSKCNCPKDESDIFCDICGKFDIKAFCKAGFVEIITIAIIAYLMIIYRGDLF